MWKDIIKDNLIGAIAGGVLVYFVPTLMSISINIMFVPTQILGWIGKILSVLLGAVIGGAIQMVAFRGK